MRMTTIVVLTVTAMATCGCSTGLMFRKTAEAGSKETTHDKSKLATFESDSWVSEAGEYTRKVHPKDEVKDPLNLRDVFTSEKAREIERNLGIGP